MKIVISLCNRPSNHLSDIVWTSTWHSGKEATCQCRRLREHRLGTQVVSRRKIALAESSEERALSVTATRTEFSKNPEWAGKQASPAEPSDKSPVWPSSTVALRQPNKGTKPSPHGLLTYRNCKMIKFGLFQAAEFVVMCYTVTEN